jgi:hypothetical protein
VSQGKTAGSEQTHREVIDVRSHLSAIVSVRTSGAGAGRPLTKLDCENRVQAALLAVQAGMLDPAQAADQQAA